MFYFTDQKTKAWKVLGTKLQGPIERYSLKTVVPEILINKESLLMILVNCLKTFLNEFIFGKVADWQPESLQRNDFFTGDFQGFCLIFRKTYFEEHVSVAAWKMMLALKAKI